MVFKIGKNNFILSAERIKYNAMKKEFTTLSIWAKEEFRKEYKSKFLNIEDVLSGVMGVANKIIEDALSRGDDILANESINGKNEAFRILYFEKYNTFKDVYNTFMKGKYQFRNPNTLALFLRGIESSVLNIHEALALIMGEEKPYFISKPIVKEDLVEIEKLYIKLRDCEELIVDILKINPYDNRAYKYILNNFGDENNEIDNLCKILDINLALIKREVIDEKFNSLKLDDEESTKESLEEFKEFSGFICYENIYEYIQLIKEKLKYYNDIYCTVNNIEFVSRDEATIAREEKELIEEEFKIIKNEEETELSLCKENLLKYNFKTSIIDDYLTNLEDRIRKSIIKSDKKILDDIAHLENIKTEENADGVLEALKVLELRSIELLRAKIEEVEGVKKSIIENMDKEKIEDIINDYIFFNIDKVYEAIEEISVLKLRTEWVRDNACEMLSEDGERLVKEHKELISKARKYEERRKNTLVEKNNNLIISFVKNIFKEKIEEYDKNKEEIEKEAWEYITKDGKRSLDDIEE